ncbi:hypothetical protein GIB67_029854 [Kingdonia uniflora]|uniref:Uncharacterized protein n=1 Tax=Kingdonia uniflora TaxID=39325 RepID=A0A7J7NJ70_9MAGN|nr:hypothetical protein GIB67_029854 [Kingdonia uniflora]
MRLGRVLTSSTNLRSSMVSSLDVSSTSCVDLRCDPSFSLLPELGNVAKKIGDHIPRLHCFSYHPFGIAVTYKSSVTIMDEIISVSTDL